LLIANLGSNSSNALLIGALSVAVIFKSNCEYKLRLSSNIQSLKIGLSILMNNL